MKIYLIMYPIRLFNGVEVDNFFLKFGQTLHCLIIDKIYTPSFTEQRE
jgi:hypothetical protein